MKGTKLNVGDLVRAKHYDNFYFGIIMKIQDINYYQFPVYIKWFNFNISLDCGFGFDELKRI